MAALVVDAAFDVTSLAAHLKPRLPAYARPIFLRLTPALEVTGTFKQRKIDLVRDGFDPATIARGEERPVFDMPGDGLRYVRDSIGVDTVVVNGQVAWAKGAYSGAASGDICALN